ncbi:N-acetyldiaminopimelate deacetylase [Streptococcus cuniculi]|uniref:N-acetyldiaminopimelate deacetylase n=1 Tax=Streptococcus cuniculi TaxID=1432788 RepID=A0A4Y9JDJ2_9STRE|nr:N-acetyldiaminopimelate deacetylase [Streptococcus cuniculi]MBF0777966.1 N-acetyldiaminopimelate deacetylase [Streptococcus cuniculi]TFU98258.1 N-acetyldiaminopimelate deacetylase [Streptococcus cuniculi]
MLDLIATRRALHQIPELGMEEFKTHAFLMEILEGLLTDCSFDQIRTWETGILVYLTGTEGKKTIGWRTDIDGLPIVEETGLDFASTHEERMHACGHDFHMTIALGLLEQMIAKQPRHNLLFLFQPAEENLAGGMLMYEAGAFGDWLPDEFYGLHVRPDLKVGQIATNRATLFAGTCEVKIRFIGRGGHAAFPHTANDALVAASYFVTQVQSVVSRNVDPIEGAVVTFGSMHAGTTNNVIAETAFLHGTIRSLTQGMSLLVQKRVREVAQGIAASFGLEVEIELNQGGYLPVENNPQLADELMTYFEAVPEVEVVDCPPAMTGEDFGYLLSKVPGVMFWLGVDTPYPLHNPRLNPKEEAIPFAVEHLAEFLRHKAAE